MCSTENLREFVNERLTAAAEEIFRVFHTTIVQYEEEIDRQRRLLDICWKPEVKLHRIELPRQHVCQEKKVLSDQQLWNWERISSPDQEDPDPPEIKEEQEELCSRQDGEMIEPKVEEDTVMLAGSEPEPEPMSDHQPGGNCGGSGSAEGAEKTYSSDSSEISDDAHQELLQQYVLNKEEVLADQQLWNWERISRLDQEDPDPPEIKEEQEELCSRQDGEMIELKVEEDTVMLAGSEPEPEPMSDHQPGGDRGGSGSAGGAEKTYSSDSSEISDDAHRELLQQYVLNKEEVLADQQLWYWERISRLDQEDPEPRGIKEEQEELCSRQDGEMIELKVEEDTVMLAGSEPEPEPMSDHQPGGDRGGSGSAGGEGTHHRTQSSSDNACSSQSSQIYLENHSGKKFFNGDSSGQSFQNHPDPRLRIHTAEKLYSCVICEKGFRHVGDLRVHMRLHTGEKPFSCSTCRKAFKASTDLTVHMRMHTGEKPFLCKTCGKNFRKSSHLKSHMRVHTGEKPFSCSTCRKAFKASSDLTVHMRTHTGEKPYSCTTCGQTFHHSSYLTRHMRMHTGEKPFLCKTCGKNFRTSSHLKSHMRVHTDEKPFSCSTCRKAFKTTSDLTVHMRTHTGEKPFSCDMCSRAFSTSGNLRVHVRTHTGEKPFSCHMCMKACNTSSELKIHMRNHTGEKPYSCDTCGNVFRTSSDLAFHTRIHTGEKPYPCKTCGKLFRTSTNLTLHMKVHAVKRPYSCKTCGEDFRSVSALYVHSRTHKGDESHLTRPTENVL